MQPHKNIGYFASYSLQVGLLILQYFQILMNVKLCQNFVIMEGAKTILDHFDVFATKDFNSIVTGITVQVR